MSDQEAPPVKQEGTLSIIVRDQHGVEVLFKIKWHTKMGKVMDAYCQKKGLDPASVRFLHDSVRIRAEQTPEELDMHDQDQVDAVIAQLGGG